METVSTVAACIAALAALAGLIFAKRTVHQGRLVIGDAETARKAAESARRDAEKDRLRSQLLRVGDLNEQLYWEAAGGMDWRGTRNLLRHALAGLKLTGQDNIISASTASQASSAASYLREIIAIELEKTYID